MITNNFLKFMQTMLASTGSNMSYNVPVTITSGQTRYLNFDKVNCFPRYVTDSFTTYDHNMGIVVGSGGTAPTKADYRLESLITSGISGSLIANTGVDNDGNPYRDFILTITNTSSAAITIREVGYIQSVSCVSSVGSSSTGTGAVLFDRSVLSQPVEIAAGDYAAIKYSLKTALPAG